MSDLRPTFDNIKIPSPDCNQPPGPALQGKDKCHVILELSDGDQTNPIRFDRQDDRFELSVKQVGGPGEFLNGQDRIHWFIEHAESSPKILQILRIFGSTLSTVGVRKPDAATREAKATFPLVIANYIVTGRAEFPKDAASHGTRDLAAVLLDVFATSDPTSVSEFIGRIASFQASAELPEEARGRASWAVSILKLVPKYRNLMDSLVLPELAARLDYEDSRVRDALGELQSFVARVVVNLGSQGNLRYDALTLQAAQAYQILHAAEQKTADFCQALAAGIRRLSPRNPAAGEGFVEHCRQTLRLSEFKPERAIREGIPVYLKGPEGMKAIEAEIQAEIRRSRMSPDWLRKRGRIDAVGGLLQKHLKVKLSQPPVTSLSLELDARGLENSLRQLIQRESLTKHREPVLAALGVLRALFGSGANRKTIHVFWEGEFQEVKIKYSETTMQAILKMLEDDLKKSFRKSELGWPIGQGVAGGLGVTALGLGLGLKSAPKGVRQGLFIGGCSAVGFSLGSLVQHSKRARNKHIWGAVGGTIGAALFGSACAVVGTQTNLFKKGGGDGMMMQPPIPDPGDRHPVDEYGP